MGRWGSKVLNFLVKITIQLFLLQTSRNVLKHIIHIKWGGHIWPFHDALRPQRFSTVKRLTKKSVLFRTLSLKGVAVGGWGSRVLNKYMEFCLKNFSFFQKKIKCSKQPKKQNKLNFYFSLSGVLNVRGGWVGSGV